MPRRAADAAAAAQATRRHRPVGEMTMSGTSGGFCDSPVPAATPGADRVAKLASKVRRRRQKVESINEMNDYYANGDRTNAQVDADTARARELGLPVTCVHDGEVQLHHVRSIVADGGLDPSCRYDNNTRISNEADSFGTDAALRAVGLTDDEIAAGRAERKKRGYKVSESLDERHLRMPPGTRRRWGERVYIKTHKGWTTEGDPEKAGTTDMPDANEAARRLAHIANKSDWTTADHAEYARLRSYLQKL